MSAKMVEQVAPRTILLQTKKIKKHKINFVRNQENKGSQLNQEKDNFKNVEEYDIFTCPCTTPFIALVVASVWYPCF